jgi:hypothetical protein
MTPGERRYPDFRSSVSSICPPGPKSRPRGVDWIDFRIRKLVGGPGFEPGASRSRIARLPVQICRFVRFSVRFFGSASVVCPDRDRFPAGLLHEVLQATSGGCGKLGTEPCDYKDRRRAFRNGTPTSLRAAECRQMPSFSTGRRCRTRWCATSTAVRSIRSRSAEPSAAWGNRRSARRTYLAVRSRTQRARPPPRCRRRCHRGTLRSRDC